jgi:hypothetical protein
MKTDQVLLYIVAPLCFLSTIACVVLLSSEKVGDPNLEKVEQGKMSKVHYQGHIYIVWGINFGGGCIHDPDCQCQYLTENKNEHK